MYRFPLLTGAHPEAPVRLCKLIIDEPEQYIYLYMLSSRILCGYYFGFRYLNMSSLTIGTAGHVDHGKSALVEALTGTHPDRLAEEQERGMTIDLGFAFMPLSDGTEVPIIDVPGHERFLKTMVAGVSGIHLVLFVVAADEGVMPQTVEHLGTVRLMGVESGLIVLTKCDLVDEEWLMLVEEDVRGLVRGTFLEHAPLLRVSSATGEGIPALKTAIEEALARVRPRQDNGIFRMPIDRAFSMKGFGTVVAGTVTSGSIAPDSPLELLPAQVPVRLRGMQTHNRPVERATAGQRVAINLANVKVEDVQRGHELSVPGYLFPTMMLDARLHLLDSLDEPLTNRTRIRLHKGTAEVIGRVVIMDQERIEPGGSGYVQFRLESALVGERYERFIIRGFSSMRLLGGGRILEVYPKKHRRFRDTVLAHLSAIETADPSMLIEQILRDSYGEQRARSIQELVGAVNLPKDTVGEIVQRLADEGRIVRCAGGRFMHRAWRERLRAEIMDRLGQLHKEQRLRETLSKEAIRSRLSSPLPAGVYDEMLRALIDEGAVEQAGTEIRLPGHAVNLTPQEQRILETLEKRALEGGVVVLSMNDLLHAAPDERPEQVKAMITYLVDRGTLVEFGERLIAHRNTLAQVRQALVAYLKTHGTARAAEFRDHLNVSRAHATALLDYFYDRGVTRREAGTHRLADPEA